MSTVTEAMIVNGVVLFAVLEADIGSHRKIGFLRIARPLLTAGAIVPIFLKAPSTHGMGLALELSAAAAGLVFGLVATGLMTVYRSPRTGRPVSRAAFGYAAVWIVVIAARSAFSYGSEHWFRSSLGTWSIDHHVTSNAITDSLIAMAIAMVLTRTVTMAARASAVPHRAAARVA